MKTIYKAVGAALLTALAVAPLRAGERERRTIESASDTAAALADVPLHCIPPALMRDAAGVAVIPHVVKAGFVVDGRFGAASSWPAGPTGPGATPSSSPWPAAASAGRPASNRPT